MRTSDVVIGGAGIIGLSLALELAGAGFSVVVLEQGEPMREASWAAAGMLAAHDPENPPALRALSELSLALYPAFLATIERLSGVAVPFRTRCTLQGSHPGQPARPVPAELLAHLPDLVGSTRSFTWLEEQSLDPRDLCRALPRAAAAAGVTLHQHATVLSVSDGGLLGATPGDEAGDGIVVQTAEGTSYRGRYYVHCTGAWAGMPFFSGLTLPVEPRKGQMLAVALPADGPQLTCVLRTPELYLVPRGDGRVIVGATVERAGFDRSLTGSASGNLLAAAAALWPPVQRGVVTEHWSGLRPGSPDLLPVIGALQATSARAASGMPAEPDRSLYVATGHYRNGILLAPGTARVLRQLLLGQSPEVVLDAFRPARFAAAAVHAGALP